MHSFATHLSSSIDGTRHELNRLQTLHEGRPLLVHYDLDGVRRHVDRDALGARPDGFWRFHELLPVQDPAFEVRLGETTTPLVRCPRLERELGVRELWIKDESRLPGGSFKARGLALAVSRAKELGVERLAIPTAGNAGGALAAYAARAGLEAWVFLPADTPEVNRWELALHGARAFLVDGLITDCGAVVGAGTETMGWFDVSTLKEPYRLEGKKTMGLELAEQFDWKLPGAILYPTGGGTGLVGMHKAFGELEELGWLESERRPRFIAAQAEGCAPIVHAFDAGERFATPVENAHTGASGLRVPKAVGDFLILDAVRESGGAALSAREAELVPWMRRVSSAEGIALCPEAAACFAVLERAIASGTVERDEPIVVFNTGAAQKYVEVLRTELPAMPPLHEIDWEDLAR